jgi:hypothetical protein
MLLTQYCSALVKCPENRRVPPSVGRSRRPRATWCGARCPGVPESYLRRRGALPIWASLLRRSVLTFTDQVSPDAARVYLEAAEALAGADAPTLRHEIRRRLESLPPGGVPER